METPAADMRKEVIGSATLYLGDCMEVLPTLGRFGAVVTDPPYGMNATNATMVGGKGSRWSLSTAKSAWEGTPLEWDDEAPPVVLSLPEMADNAIIWGGQFFPLPSARGWLVWNKIIRNFSSSVCELAWTNLDKPVDCFDYSHGQLATEGKFHPTQKPLPLMVWCVRKTKGHVLDPFMGAGTTGVACARMGRPFTGIEMDEAYFDIACRRIEEAQKQPDMLVTIEQPEPETLDLLA